MHTWFIRAPTLQRNGGTSQITQDTPTGRHKGDVGVCRFGGLSSHTAPTGPGVAALSANGSIEYRLEAGDAIFVPPYFWHAVYAEHRAPARAPSVTATYFVTPGAQSHFPSPDPSQLECLSQFQ